MNQQLINNVLISYRILKQYTFKSRLLQEQL